MSNSFNGISIPDELLSFSVGRQLACVPEPVEYGSSACYHRNSNGCVDYVDFYSAQRILEKRIFYDGTSIDKIDYYYQDIRYKQEVFKNDRLYMRCFYQDNDTRTEENIYDYNRKGKLTGILKKRNHKEFLVKYEYDELDRINVRKVYVDSRLLIEQKYRFDILDRIAEYRDLERRIVVTNIAKTNELISYTITDKMGNIMVVVNHFSFGAYVNTDVTLNGHSATVQDKSYVDNVMLKKPFATEDDLDLIISTLMNTVTSSATKRKSLEEILEDNPVTMISENIQVKTLPISIRKRLLYSMAMKNSA